jgi:hypothetical protein
LATGAMSRYERLGGALRRAKDELKAGARIGTHAMLAGAGGIAAGFVEAKMPMIPNTTLRTNAVGGAALVLGAVTGIFSEYSDQIGSFGAGVLALSLGKEAEAYFQG